MRAGLHFTVVLFAACSVDLPDEPGLRCDDEHPCSDGRDCVAGFCRDEAGGGGSGGGDVSTGGGGVAGGSSGGGTAGGGTGGGGTAGGGTAGGGTAGGGVSADAGSVLWLQEAHGFTGTQDFGTATLTIRADAGNQVVSTVLNASDANDRATANQADAGHLPQLGHGRLKGRFRLASALNLSANSTFVRLENAGSVIVSLAFNSSEQLVVRSDSNFIDPLALTQTISWPGGFQPNTDYTVDVAWQRGQYRSLFINGVDAGTLRAMPPPMNLVPPTQLRLGIYRYDGDAGTGWSVTLSDWALADGPTVPL